MNSLIIIAACLIFVFFIIGAFKVLRELKRKEKNFMSRNSHPNVMRNNDKKRQAILHH